MCSPRPVSICCCCCRGRETTPVPVSPKMPAVIVFWDSTVDMGNNNVIDTMLKSNFPPYGRDMAGAKATGRFCNGRLPPEFISEALGLPPLVLAYLDPVYGIQDFAHGVCFPSAGAGLDNATAGVLVSRAKADTIVMNDCSHIADWSAVYMRSLLLEGLDFLGCDWWELKVATTVPSVEELQPWASTLSSIAIGAGH